MKKVQVWLQENMGIILGVCVGVAVTEVGILSPPSPPQPYPIVLALLRPPGG